MKYKLIKSGNTVNGQPTYKTHIDNIFITWEDKNRGLLKIFNTDVPIRDTVIITMEVLEDSKETLLHINHFADQMDKYNANPIVILDRRRNRINFLIKEVNKAIAEYTELVIKLTDEKN